MNPTSNFALKSLSGQGLEFWQTHDLSIEKKGDAKLLVVSEKAGGIGQGLMRSRAKEEVAEKLLDRMERYINQLDKGDITKADVNTVGQHVGFLIKKLTAGAPSNPLMHKYTELNSRLDAIRKEQ